ncbi:MAG: GTPase HflX [Clostridia bacterium]|nr:GTPase HflX [Clostridia bacterium]
MNKVNGNTGGIKDTVLEALAECYNLKSRNSIVSDEISGILATISSQINKEVCVMIARDGTVLDVSIGDAGSVALKHLNTTRSDKGLCGVRCIHTHPSGSGMLSSVDLGSLMSQKYDAMVALGLKEGKVYEISVGILNKMEEEGLSYTIYGMFKQGKLPHDALFDEISNAIALGKGEDYVEEKERALLIGLDTGLEYDSLEELAALCENAGLEVIARTTQKRDKADSAFYVGKGKLEEIALQCSAERIGTVVCDDELSSNQNRNIEEKLGVKVIDRTTVILDIFAQRATSREGKLQVELAQQKYRLPRLHGLGRVLSRLGGGIGTRGPGEKKLEIDQRHIKRRIHDLEDEIKEIEKQRNLRRKNIEQNEVPVVALVGYTNAGKSSLLNRLSGSDVYVKNQLFATLDPTIKKVHHNFDFLVSDTVGFINKLPHDLVSAFKSTLEQAEYANLILHVIDSSSSYFLSQTDVVEKLLKDLNTAHIPVINVYNKWENSVLNKEDLKENSVCISAKTGYGIENLLDLIEDSLFKSHRDMEIVIPYDKGGLQQIVRKGIVEKEEYIEEGIYFKVKLKNQDADKIEKELNL